MMRMTKFTLTHNPSHSEVVALAIRSWPMPCVIEVVKPIPYNTDWFYMYRERVVPKYMRRYLNKGIKRNHRRKMP